MNTQKLHPSGAISAVNVEPQIEMFHIAPHFSEHFRS